MKLNEALVQIEAIHAHLTRAETYRGFRAASIAAGGGLACLAAVIQAFAVPEPAADITAYIQLWVSIAAANVALVLLGLIIQYMQNPATVSARQTRQAVEQFLPCVLAGASLTWAILQFSRESAVLLPGLWSIVFSLGVFSTRRQLPSAIVGVAAHYLLGGVACIALARGDHALSPFAMAGTFGVGQLLTSAVLYWTLERQHG